MLSGADGVVLRSPFSVTAPIAGPRVLTDQGHGLSRGSKATGTPNG